MNGRIDGALRAFSGIWAGAVIGGSLIAAPAKFEAPSLTLSVALEVGRAQFAWLGFAELALCGLLVACALWRPGATPRLPFAAAVLFGIQRLAVMPALDERTVRAIAGQSLDPSRLHWIYIALEVVKVAVLLAVAFGLGANGEPDRDGVDSSTVV